MGRKDGALRPPSRVSEVVALLNTTTLLEVAPLHLSDDRRNKPSFRNNDKRPVIGLGCTPEAFLQQKGQHPFQLSVELRDNEPRLSQRPHPTF